MKSSPPPTATNKRRNCGPKEDILVRLAELSQVFNETRPANSVTVREYAAHSGIDVNNARRRLEKYVESGIMESKTFILGDGKPPTKVFWFTEGKD